MRSLARGVVLLSTLVLVGCASAASGSGAPTAAQDAVVTFLVPDAEPTAFMDAKIGGTLALSEGGCFVIGYEDGTARSLQFPYGSELTADASGVDVPGLGVVRVGDEIGGGGGVETRQESVADACSVSDKIVVLWQTV